MVKTSSGEVEVGTRVYVGNLSYRTSWQDLKDHMKKAGDVRHADILMDKTDRHAGGGIVEFSHSEDAARAINELHNTELDGRLIFIREDREDTAIGGRGRASRVKRSPPRGVGGSRMGMSMGMGMGMGMGPGGSRYGDMRSSPFGGIVDPYTYGQMYERYADMMVHGDRGRAADDYQRALQNISSKMSHMVGFEPAGYLPPPKSSGGSLVFVGNLSYDVSWQDLKDVFRDHGFRDIHVSINEVDGKSKGSAMVKFDDPREAAQAIARLHDFPLQGRRMDVHYERFGGR